MSRKASEMEHLSLFRGSSTGTWREDSHTEDSKRHVMEGTETVHFFYKDSIREPTALSEAVLGQYDY
jgi:hypothetical protein